MPDAGAAFFVSDMDFRDARADEIETIRAFILEQGASEWNYLSPAELDPHLAGLNSGQTIGVVAETRWLDGRHRHLRNLCLVRSV